MSNGTKVRLKNNSLLKNLSDTPRDEDILRTTNKFHTTISNGDFFPNYVAIR